MRVYYDNALIYDSGPVSFTNHVSIPFGPGVSTNIVITMNEGNSTNANTLWEYTATVACPGPAYLVFTENTNLAPAPIKFASAPFLPGGTNLDLYCLPEAIAQHPRRRERLRDLATGDVGHSRRSRRSRAGTGQLAVALRLPEHRSRADRLDPRDHRDQHRSSRPGRPLLRRCASLGNPCHQPPGLCLRARERALQPELPAHGHQRGGYHAAVRLDRRGRRLNHQRHAPPGSRRTLLSRDSEPRRRQSYGDRAGGFRRHAVGQRRSVQRHSGRQSPAPVLLL